MCMGALPTCMYVCHIHVWCPCDQNKMLDFLGLELQIVTMCCWELNPLEEQLLLLITKPSLQPPNSLSLSSSWFVSLNEVARRPLPDGRHFDKNVFLTFRNVKSSFI